MAVLGNSPTQQAYAPQIDYFSGNGSTTAFTLSRPIATAAQVIVFVENVPQNPSSAFTVSGTTLTFTSAPPSGTNNIWVEYTSLITQMIQPAQGTVVASSFAAGVVPPGTVVASSFAGGVVPSGTVTSSSFASGASEFTTGTKLSFAQAAAPTGWTQVTDDTADNRMFRVVKTAGAGTGGSHSPILNNVVPAHTHGFTTGNQSADHSHTWGNWSGGQNSNHSHTMAMYGAPLDFNPGGGNYRIPYTTDGGYAYPQTFGYSNDHAHYTSGTTSGMNVNHTHSGSTDNGSSSTNWAPRYIDLILCAKS